MNLFILDYSPKLAAQYHCDKHVVKMILETAQLLSTAHHHFGSPTASEMYRATHHNHPCSLWVRETHENYGFAFEMFDHLCQEYTKRYGRKHASERMMSILQYPPEGIPGTWATPFVQCMPDVYKRRDPVDAYRAYYNGEKARFARWNYSPEPEWFAPTLKESTK